MKKIVVIFTLIVVLLAPVFADGLSDIHQTRLKTRVGSVSPAFQLEFTSGMSDQELVHSIIDAEDNTPFEVADIASVDLDLLFKVKLSNNAKCNTMYSIVFSAGSFDVTRFEVPGTLDPSGTPVIAAAPSISALLGVKAGVISGQTLQIRFTGAECVPGDLATYSVQYTHDPRIDPNLEGYYADILLEISSDF